MYLSVGCEGRDLLGAGLVLRHRGVRPLLALPPANLPGDTILQELCAQGFLFIMKPVMNCRVGGLH